eukprot:5115855-Pyramimonas_sp.AAC.1
MATPPPPAPPRSRVVRVPVRGRLRLAADLRHFLHELRLPRLPLLLPGLLPHAVASLERQP